MIISCYFKLIMAIIFSAVDGEPSKSENSNTESYIFGNDVFQEQSKLGFLFRQIFYRKYENHEQLYLGFFFQK